MPFQKIYVFPLTINKKEYNPYVSFLANSLLKQFEIVNSNQKKNIGVFDFIKYRKANVYILNWPENIYRLKYGKIQSILFIGITFLLKIFNRKFIWILHNKAPHTGINLFSKILMKYNSWLSNIVITHSKEGISFYKNNFGRSNITYFPHPIYPQAQFTLETIKYDFIIWGNVEPYKNILEFLKFISQDIKWINFKILICGRCNDIEYHKQIQKYLTSNITYIGEYIDTEKLNYLISSSRNILFTYCSNSILSSGALVYSLSSKKLIIGPNIGAFKDYQELGLIRTYHHFNEIISVSNCLHNNQIDLQKHLEENSWESFPNKFLDILNCL